MRRIFGPHTVQRMMVGTAAHSRRLAVVLLIGLAGLAAGLASDEGVEDRPRADRTDLHGDPLPARALARMGTVRFRPGGPAGSVDYSPGGDVLAASVPPNTIILFDPSTGREILRIPGPETGVRRVVFSSRTGVRAIQCGIQAVHLTDPVSDSSSVVRLGDAWLSAIALDPDGKTLAAAGMDYDDRAFIRLYGVPTWKHLRTIERGKAEILSLAFSPDGRRLASGDEDEAVRLWDPAAGDEVLAIEDVGDRVVSVEFSPGGETLAFAVSGKKHDEVRLWDLEKGTGGVDLSSEGVPVNTVTFSPDGRTLASADKESTIRLWDVDSGRRIREIEGGRGQIYMVDFAPDGKTLASCGQDEKIRLWDVATGKELREDDGHVARVGQVAFSPDGKTLASSGEQGDIRLWDVTSGRMILSLDGHETPFSPLAFSPDGKTLAYGRWDATIRMVDLSAGKEVSRIEEKGRARHLAFSPDGRRLATASRFTVRLWDLAKIEKTVLYHEKDGRIGRIAFSPEGDALFAACSSSRRGREILGWEIASGREVLRHARGPRRTVAFHIYPGRRVLEALMGVNRIELALTGEDGAFSELKGARDVVFSADGRMVATPHTGNVIHIWEAATGRRILHLHGHRGAVSSLSFSPDGRTLASGSADATVLVWDLSPPGWSRPSGPVGVDPVVLEEAWASLASADDGERPHRAIWTLVAGGERTIDLIRIHFLDARADCADRIERLIVDLDDADYQVRERAHEELRLLGGLAAKALRRAYENPPSPEVRMRAGVLLDAIASADLPCFGRYSSEMLRRLRAIQILERIGTEGAREVLEAIADGDYADETKSEAEASLRRLASREAGRR